MDWNHLQAFLETAQRGSFSAAARHLGLTQPTLSRQVMALEQALGVTLFERVGRSVVVTQAGVGLLEHARRMGAAAEALTLAATGSSQGVEGVVMVSASDAIAAYVLPPIVERLRHAAPGVVLEVIASNALSDLRRREADIAIRHVRPQESELIGRLVRDARAHFYASRAWVAQHGHPRTVEEALQHRFVGADRAGTFVGYLRAQGLPLSQEHFSVVTEHSVVSWQLVRQGLGIGVMMDEIADATPDVVRVIDELPAITFPVWLVTHRELHTARRIRVVFDLLALALTQPDPASLIMTA